MYRNSKTLLTKNQVDDQERRLSRQKRLQYFSTARVKTPKNAGCSWTEQYNFDKSIVGHGMHSR